MKLFRQHKQSTVHAENKDGYIDSIILHENIIYIIGWFKRAENLKSVQIEKHKILAHQSEVKIARYDRADISSGGCDFEAGIFIACEVKNCASDLVFGAANNFIIEFDDGSIIRAEEKFIVALEDARQKNALHVFNNQKTLESVKHCIGSNNSLMIDYFGTSASGHIHIDDQLWLMEGGVFVSGWVKDASIMEVKASILDSDECEDVYIHHVSRPDVTEHLVGKNVKLDSDDSSHGFSVCILFREGVNIPDRVMLEFKDKSNRKTLAYCIVDRRGLASLKDVLDKILLHSSQGSVVPSASLSKAIVELHQRSFSARKIGVEKEKIYAPILEPKIDGVSDKPKVSIIVPFYGEDFFIHHLVQMQSVAPAYVEWILVCDDPKLKHSLEQYLDNKSFFIQQKTRLVVLDKNYGFASANNIGLSYAEGEFVLLMNSDIYCESFDWMEYTLDIFREHENIGAIGYTLQYEDGTVQHAGMHFGRDVKYENNYLTFHPGKGLPVQWKNRVHREVEACTAALLMIPKSQIADSIFSTEYIIGDFEDGDLNMKLKKQGKKILLVETPDIYHLERQSLRNVGDPTTRQRITMLNCVTFNSHWASVLDQREGL